MISRPFQITIAVLFVAAGAATWTLLHLQNTRDRARIAGLRRMSDEAAHLRSEIARNRELLATTAANKDAAAQTMHAEIMRLRTEVAELEQRAAAGRIRHVAQSAADTVAFAQNRDPVKGFVRVENLTAAGQTTPAAAFQTLVWAAMNGRDDIMAQTVMVTGPAREAALAVLASLSESEREKWPTPEKLVALFFARGLLKELLAFQITEETLADADHATLRLRFPGQSNEPQVMLERSATGWAVVVPEKQIDRIRAELAGESTPIRKP